MKKIVRRLTLFSFAFFAAFTGAYPAEDGIFYFSPGTDSEKNKLVIPFSISGKNYITSWHFIVTDNSGKTVRDIGEDLPSVEVKPENWKEMLSVITKPKRSVDIPHSITWDGKNNAGTLCRDGTYLFYITSADDNENYSESRRFRAIVDTERPTVNVVTPSERAKTFGDSVNKEFIITQSGSREDLWTGEIRDESGKIVRTFLWRDAAPSRISWDGKNDNGITLPDGYYSYGISAVDAAGNRSLPAGISGIHLESITPEAEIGRSAAELAPNGKTKKQTFNIGANLKSGIASWTVNVLSTEGGETVRKWSKSGDTLPETIVWDGKTDSGVIAEGTFKAALQIDYIKGNVARGETLPFFCTGKAPEISLKPTPDFFSPDGDGENDILYMVTGVRSVLPVASWSLTIIDPAEKTFAAWNGKSEVPRRIEWSGRGDNGDTVESAMDYPFVFTVTDVQEQSSTVKGNIPIDVLVLRDGSRYIMRVPAIIFRANNADFVSKTEDKKRGLEQNVIDNNIRVLSRIAEILKKFNGYRIRVEGHANSETGSEKEEIEQLVPLSEKRAAFVRDRLVEYGIAYERLSIEGAGGRRPVMKNRRDRANWWKNRRVEFVLQK